MLMTIAQELGGIEPLLDCFFAFMHRRTDMYYVMPDDGMYYKMGFMEGAAEKLVSKTFI